MSLEKGFANTVDRIEAEAAELSQYSIGRSKGFHDQKENNSFCTFKNTISVFLRLRSAAFEKTQECRKGEGTIITPTDFNVDQ